MWKMLQVAPVSPTSSFPTVISRRRISITLTLRCNFEDPLSAHVCLSVYICSCVLLYMFVSIPYVYLYASRSIYVGLNAVRLVLDFITVLLSMYIQFPIYIRL